MVYREMSPRKIITRVASYLRVIKGIIDNMARIGFMCDINIEMIRSDIKDNRTGLVVCNDWKLPAAPLLICKIIARRIAEERELRPNNIEKFKRPARVTA